MTLVVLASFRNKDILILSCSTVTAQRRANQILCISLDNDTALVDILIKMRETGGLTHPLMTISSFLKQVAYQTYLSVLLMQFRAAA